ncbi:Putative merR family bacterial regulatory protein [Legionella busanensis]|uniref:MerR family bacterial regulatory protein n=1 Tax=Legionella busanensis TaxID=190655 RepID=A0A378K9C3_9GAMM|nr:helix-turn-helix domain-containing protein [Legionella busanensis]STX81316.1 Putative merR family bacterial regulatory protein [Legionella busanensis]
MVNRDIGNEIVQGMKEAIDYVRGNTGAAKIHKIEVPATIDVRAIRKKLNLSRQQFADSFGFSPRTLQHWEQGDRSPHGSARVLLLLLQREPATIAKILRGDNNF